MKDSPFKIAPTGKRALALFIDAFIAFILASVLFSFVTGKYMFKAIGGMDAQNAAFKYANDSGLFNNAPNEAGDYEYSSLQLYEYQSKKSDTQDKYGYEYYLDIVWSYYTDFVPNHAQDKIEGCDTPENAQKYFYSTVMVMSNADTTKTYADQASVEQYTNDFFTYTLGDDNKIDLSKKPTPLNEVNDDNADLYMAYFITQNNNSATGVYYNAAYSFSLGDTFTKLTSEISHYNWLCYLVAFIPVQLIVFYVMPIALKNGKTIGKLISGVSVVQDGGVRINTLTRFLRPIPMTLIGMVMLLPFNKIVSILAWAALVALDYFVMVFKHEDKVGHDYLFKTIVIEDAGSKIFDSKEESDAFFAETKAKEAEKVIYDHSDVKLTIEDEE